MLLPLISNAIWIQLFNWPAIKRNGRAVESKRQQLNVDKHCSLASFNLTSVAPGVCVFAFEGRQTDLERG